MKHAFTITAILSSALAACTGQSATSTAESADTLTLLVGSYSEPGDSALRVYRFNPADGTARLLGALPVANASYAAFGPGGMVYSVTEDTAKASMVASISPTDSVPSGFTVVGRQPVGAEAPCYVTVSPDGRFVATANYGGGSAAVFPVRDGRELGERCQLLQFDGRGPVEGRQDGPHAHCVAFTPEGRYMLVTDLGADRIRQFEVLKDADSLVATEPVAEILLEPGSGPRHIVFDSKGTKAYLINEISDKVTVLDCDGHTLTPVQYIAADTVGAQGAGDIHLSPDGRRLYASLRLKHEGIATFDVDSLTGQLTHTAHTPTGGHPRNFAITPDGRWMLVACRDADGVEIYRIDPSTGALTMTGRIDQPRAVLVKVVPGAEAAIKQ